MTDNVRRRRSKWDVTVEPDFLGESRDDNDFPGEREVQSGSNSLNLDIPQEDVVMKPSDGFSRMDKSPKWAAMEQAEGKNSLGERDSRNRTVRDGLVTREMGGHSSASNQEYGSGRSPGRDAWRQRSHNISPRGGGHGRGRSGRSRSRSRSRGRSRSRSRTRSRSRSRSWSRSRSRSRSPFGMKRGSERLSARGRNRAGGQGPPCRDFTVGRCRRGSQCRYLHEDGGRGEFDRYHTHSREAKLERGSSWRSGKESLTSPRDQNDYSRNMPLQRQQSHYDDGDRGKPDSHRIDKSSDLCFDFTKGRCQRGSSCRYLHHETSSRGGWSMKDETRDENYDRMAPDASLGQRSESRPRNEAPCKFFAEGRCRRGHNCRFAHQGIDSMGSGPDGDAQDYDQVTRDGSSKKFPSMGDQTVAMDTITPSQWTHGGIDGVRAALSQSVEMRDSAQKHQHQQTQKTGDDDPQMLVSKVHQELDSQVPAVSINLLDKSADVQQFSSNSEVLHQKGGRLIPDRSAAKPEMNPVPSAAGQSFSLSGPSQFISQQLHAQNFASGIQIPQVVAPLPFNGQMQQVAYPMHPNGQSQFMQSQPAIPRQHAVQNLQNPGEKNQQNVAPTAQNGPNQQNMILSVHNPQFLLSPVKGQSLHSLHPDGQVQQNVLPLNERSPHDLGLIGPRHPGIIPSHNGHNQNPSLELPLDNSFKSDNHPASFMPGEGSFTSSGAPEIKPSLVGSASAISHKVVTSEQAARITDLSASLAQFFGAIPPSIQPSQGSAKDGQHGATSNDSVPVKLEISKLPTDPRLQNSEKNSNSSLPVPATDHSGKHENNDATQIEPSGNDPVKEVNGTETGGHDKKNEEKTQEAGADAADGENKQSKDAKASKMFKYALAEFVKDMLKPAWKEGQLSREAHKTIVKKVVDKVTGAVQGPNIPQTQEKIDIYLTHSKAKLSKLVQAYVEKYVKN